MNSKTASATLKRVGYGDKLIAHTLRSVASTALNEAGFNHDAIEVALAYSDKNEIRTAYKRSTYLNQCVEFMTWWVKQVYIFYLLIQLEIIWISHYTDVKQLWFFMKLNIL